MISLGLASLVFLGGFPPTVPVAAAAMAVVPAPYPGAMIPAMAAVVAGAGSDGAK